MAITDEKIRWVAHLARLEMAEAELQALTGQLSTIIDYINQLQELDTEGVEPLAHALEIHDVFRADQPGLSLTVDDALANAPQRKDDYYAVPAVFDD